MGFLVRSAVVLIVGAFASVALAAPAPIILILKEHKFSPSTLTVPAGERFTVQLVNRDMASEEFDSDELMTEKTVTPGGKVTFAIGPLTPGTYAFQGELHPATAQGHLIVQAR